MSKLKLQMATISQDDIKQALDNAPTGNFTSYSGPTPPPGAYKAKCTGLYLTEVKSGVQAGQDAIRVGFEIQNEEYKGAYAPLNLTVPSDPTYQHFGAQISSMDRALRALSKGKLGISGFVEAANKNQIHAEPTKTGNAQRITQIGKFKPNDLGEFDITTRTFQTSDGKTLASTHFIADWDGASESKVDNDTDDDLDFSFDDDDLDLG